jgi:hypothetical protein
LKDDDDDDDDDDEARSYLKGLVVGRRIILEWTLEK